MSIKITSIGGSKYFEIISCFGFGAYIASHQDFSVLKTICLNMHLFVYITFLYILIKLVFLYIVILVCILMFLLLIE